MLAELHPTCDGLTEHTIALGLVLKHETIAMVLTASIPDATLQILHCDSSLDTTTMVLQTYLSAYSSRERHKLSSRLAAKLQQNGSRGCSA